MVDSGDDNDTIAITNAVERTTVDGSGADSINIGVVSKGYVLAGVGNDTLCHWYWCYGASLRAGIGDDLMSISGGITDGSLWWLRKRQF